MACELTHPPIPRKPRSPTGKRRGECPCLGPRKIKRHEENETIIYERLAVYMYIPIPSMYGIFTYIWLISMVNVGKYTSHLDPMGYLMYTIYYVTPQK